MDLRNFASWMAIIGTCALTAFFFGFLAYHSLKKTSSDSSWLLSVLEEHFAATVTVPLSAISAACIVILLGVATGGDLSFDAGLFTFKGASGPVTLWLVCFIAMIVAVKALWSSRSTRGKNYEDSENGEVGSAQHRRGADGV